jgi:hypothetical protein
MANFALRSAVILGEAMAFTGDDGLMQKIYLMLLFCSSCAEDEFSHEAGVACAENLQEEFIVRLAVASEGISCHLLTPPCTCRGCKKSSIEQITLMKEFVSH